MVVLPISIAVGHSGLDCQISCYVRHIQQQLDIFGDKTGVLLDLSSSPLLDLQTAAATTIL
ncbi:hypothetical protein B6S44_06895 [Bosea sp. Tri-44]|nr:hypothetical protein B6S44_06895 [Bosea sp. Tri-44]